MRGRSPWCAAVVAVALAAVPLSAVAEDAGPGAALDGTWRIVSIGAGFLDPAVTGKTPQIVFDAGESRFAATVGCNQFAGGYDRSGGAFAFDAAVISTKMLCPDPLGALEADFAAMLPEVRGIAVADGAAALLDADGAARAILIAVE